MYVDMKGRLLHGATPGKTLTVWMSREEFEFCKSVDQHIRNVTRGARLALLLANEDYAEACAWAMTHDPEMGSSKVHCPRDLNNGSTQALSNIRADLHMLAAHLGNGNKRRGLMRAAGYARWALTYRYTGTLPIFKAPPFKPPQDPAKPHSSLLEVKYHCIGVLKRIERMLCSRIETEAPGGDKAALAECRKLLSDLTGVPSSAGQSDCVPATLDTTDTSWLETA